MSRELQERGFAASAYERPNQKWECGWAAEGRPCPLGPDHRGNCVVTHQCTPSLRGDRWICARSAALGGGCEEGPFPDGTCCNAISPCQPQPSLRTKRGRLSAWVAGVTVAVIALAVTGEDGLEFISPGSVSLRHGSVGECSDCHASASDGAAHWFTAGFVGEHGAGDTERCLACHATTLGEFSRFPHSVSVDELRGVTEGVASQSMDENQSITLALARVASPPTDQHGTMACASCHKEHRGRDHDLTAMNNDQCQVCHAKPFASFAIGHPAFTNYPYERRTRIQFNHVAHKNDAYPEKRDFRCQDCHQLDVDGQVMLVVGYEGACGGCHAADVDTSTGLFKRSGLYPGNSADGVPFLSLPGFDPDALAEHGIAVGEWPEDATLDLEGPVGPYMRLLLSADEDVASALDRLPSDLSFTDLSDLEEDEQFEAVGKVLWGVKALIYDIAVDGQSAVHERLSAGLGRSVPNLELSVLTANLDVTLVEAARREWFPHLLVELPAYRDGQVARTSLISTEGAESEVSVGWYRSGSFDLRYRPSGHQDPFLRRWLEVSLKRRDEAPKGVLEALFAHVASPSAEGGCVKCHSIDAEGDNLAINWNQRRRDLIRRGPNRFVHSPHMTALSVAGESTSPVRVEVAPDDAHGAESADEASPAELAEFAPAAHPSSSPRASCSQCHVLSEESADATDESFKGHDPTSFTSSFLPIEKSTCTGCHVSGEADDRCLNCHNYHVGESLPAVRPEEQIHSPVGGGRHAFGARETPAPSS